MVSDHLATLRETCDAFRLGEQRALKALQAERESNTANMAELRRADAELGKLRAELADVSYLDQAARTGGTRVLNTMPVKLPGIDEDHIHFVLMPIGAVSRRAAVVWLKAQGAPEDQSLSPDSERALAEINAIVAERYGLEPQGAPPEGEWHTCCGNKLSFGQRCPDCRTIRYREC